MKSSKNGITVLMRLGSFVDTNLSFYITENQSVM